MRSPPPRPTSQRRRVLEERLAALPALRPAIVNKSPYHTVRLPWLKAIFPDSFVVAIVRRAVPNIYSLTKKYLRTDERDRPWREDGWYGVKPRGWRSLLSDVPHEQCTNQWVRGDAQALGRPGAHRLAGRLSPPLREPGRRSAAQSFEGRAGSSRTSPPTSPVCVVSTMSIAAGPRCARRTSSTVWLPSLPSRSSCPRSPPTRSPGSRLGAP